MKSFPFKRLILLILSFSILNLKKISANADEKANKLILIKNHLQDTIDNLHNDWKNNSEKMHLDDINKSVSETINSLKIKSHLNDLERKILKIEYTLNNVLAETSVNEKVILNGTSLNKTNKSLFISIAQAKRESNYSNFTANQINHFNDECKITSEVSENNIIYRYYLKNSKNPIARIDIKNLLNAKSVKFILKNIGFIYGSDVITDGQRADQIPTNLSPLEYSYMTKKMLKNIAISSISNGINSAAATALLSGLGLGYFPGLPPYLFTYFFYNLEMDDLQDSLTSLKQSTKIQIINNENSDNLKFFNLDIKNVNFMNNRQIHQFNKLKSDEENDFEYLQLSCVPISSLNSDLKKAYELLH